MNLNRTNKVLLTLASVALGLLLLGATRSDVLETSAFWRHMLRRTSLEITNVTGLYPSLDHLSNSISSGTVTNIGGPSLTNAVTGDATITVTPVATAAGTNFQLHVNPSSAWSYDINTTNTVNHGGPDYGSAVATLMTFAAPSNSATHVELAIVGRGATNAWTGKIVFGFARTGADPVLLAEAAGGDWEVVETDLNMDVHTQVSGTNVDLLAIGAPNERMAWALKGQMITLGLPSSATPEGAVNLDLQNGNSLLLQNGNPLTLEI